MSTPKTRINYKLSIFLSICCIFMVIILLIEWFYNNYSEGRLLNEMESVTAASTQMSSLPEIALTEKTLESYEQMVSRPLFLKDRRPVENAESSSTNISSDKMELILTGVVAKPEGMIAMLQDKEKQSYQLQLHDGYKGWQVEAINAEKVVFVRNTERNELLLRKPFKQASNTLPLANEVDPEATPPGKQNQLIVPGNRQSRKQRQ